MKAFPHNIFSQLPWNLYCSGTVLGREFESVEIRGIYVSLKGNLRLTLFCKYTTKGNVYFLLLSHVHMSLSVSPKFMNHC